MSKPRPCQHRRYSKVRHFPHLFEEASEGRPQVWCVVEVYRCVKCESEWGQYAHNVHGKDERSVLKAYGVPEADLPTPANHKAKPAVTAPLEAWPFPTSTYYPKPVQETPDA